MKEEKKWIKSLTNAKSWRSYKKKILDSGAFGVAVPLHRNNYSCASNAIFRIYIERVLTLVGYLTSFLLRHYRTNCGGFFLNLSLFHFLHLYFFFFIFSSLLCPQWWWRIYVRFDFGFVFIFSLPCCSLNIWIAKPRQISVISLIFFFNFFSYFTYSSFVKRERDHIAENFNWMNVTAVWPEFRYRMEKRKMERKKKNETEQYTCALQIRTCIQSQCNRMVKCRNFRSRKIYVNESKCICLCIIPIWFHRFRNCFGTRSCCVNCGNCLATHQQYHRHLIFGYRRHKY